MQKAKHWQVPQPHPRSKLLKIPAYRSGSTDFYALGFVDPGKPDRALIGFDYLDISKKKGTKDVPEPDVLSLKDISTTRPHSEVFGVNSGLITGIQILRRGNEKLGVGLINKALGEDSGHHRSPFRSPAGEPPTLMLARSCLAASLNEITSSKPEFPKIKQRIERLLADQPKLKSETTDWVIKALKANVEHKPSPEGSIERIIDDYLLGGGTEGVTTLELGEFAPAEQALILKGFEAVPALLKQRHSERFTNHLMQGFNNFSSYPMLSGQVINAYLQRLANSEFGSNWLERQQGYVAKDKAVLAWWKRASALGEEAFVKKYTVIIKKKKKKKSAKLSHELLLIAQERYPSLLPVFYRKLLKTTRPSRPVVDAIMPSKAFSREQKIELLLTGIVSNHQAHRNNSLANLRDLDPALADKHLLMILKKAPKTPEEVYWRDQDAGLGRLVTNSLDPKVWQALHALLDRADLGMRMELIRKLRPPHDAPAEILRSYHEVFVRFRDDKTVRDNSTSELFDGPDAGFPHDKIAMRDFIHLHWARWLKLELKAPERGATSDEWKTYRDSVAPTIQKRSAKPGAPADEDKPRR